MDFSSYKPKGRIEHKHLINLLDYSTADIYEILHLAQSLKAAKKRGKKHELLRGKTVAMLFSEPSTRSRVAFEIGIRDLGARSIFISGNDTHITHGETVRDTSRALSCYGLDGVIMRTNKQSDLEEFAANAGFSTVNGRTADFHPCQALTDIFTIAESCGRLNDVKLAYFGKCGSTANSLMLAGAKTGMNVYICAPKGCEPSNGIVDAAQKFGNVTITDNIEEAATDADILYTDAYTVFETDKALDAENRATLEPYRVDSRTLEMAKKDAVFMHCLPTRRGEEVTETVIDSTHSIVFEQAENLLHVQKAIMCLLMGKK